MMKIKLMFMLAILLLVTGCVSQKDYDALQGKYNKLASEYEILTSDYKNLSDNVTQLTATLSELQSVHVKLQGKLATPVQPKCNILGERQSCYIWEGGGDCCEQYVEWSGVRKQYYYTKQGALWGCTMEGTVKNKHPNWIMDDIGGFLSVKTSSLGPSKQISFLMNMECYTSPLTLAWRWTEPIKR